MALNQIVYIELPAAKDVATLKSFYHQLFGWNFKDFGEEYSAFSEAGLEGGINGVGADKTKAPLVLIETDHIEAMEDKVRNAGGAITLPTFSFPGGRRFHFTDPAGNELSIMQPDRV